MTSAESRYPSSGPPTKSTNYGNAFRISLHPNPQLLFNRLIIQARPQIPVHRWWPIEGFRSWGLFLLNSRGNFSGPEIWFVFVAFAFKSKVSIILRIIQWNYKLTWQNWLVCGLGTVLLFNWLDFRICLCPRKVSGPFEKRAPVSQTDLNKSLVPSFAKDTCGNALLFIFRVGSYWRWHCCDVRRYGAYDLRSTYSAWNRGPDGWRGKSLASFLPCRFLTRSKLICKLSSKQC